ncbi:hypothetical protein NONI108955_10180 [Nocardia ninae]|uniref:Uncharacterized protein n=1 Tax=Nocardia ninae NBRC 108245 TaxID=1210091 RepID=A0A511M9H1_9NOCA|nr:hypothetical protein [Nocardia ninae]GEM36857.1 hypothetical protein NN4_13760 [Nocardia ninae NBRC 108245]
MIKTTFAVTTIALGLVAAGSGLAAAEEVQVEGNYATATACQADGPNVEVERDNAKWTKWECRQGNDGLWYLYLSN